MSDERWIGDDKRCDHVLHSSEAPRPARCHRAPGHPGSHVAIGSAGFPTLVWDLANRDTYLAMPDSAVAELVGAMGPFIDALKDHL